MKFLKNIEELILNIIKENELETSVSSSKIQQLIEINMDNNLKSESDSKNFFLNNESLEIYSNETLILINILNPKTTLNNFDIYFENAQSYIQSEVDSFVKSNNLENAGDTTLDVDVFVYLIVNNFEELIQVQKASKIKLNKIKKIKFTLNIDARTHPLNREIKSEINIDSRLESIKFLQEEGAEGYIFTANLFDVTKLYKEIGKDLFSSNLRIGIKDQNNVDESIKTTILNDHTNFWYYNNGITLIVKEDNVDFGNPDKIILTYKDIKDFTIVNGAQTVTSASEVFYNPSELFKKNKLNIESQTKVLLRVIKVPKEKTSPKDLISKIAISLNRQKPITQEDIAYVIKFIDMMNVIKSKEPNSEYGFSIIRRGEGENLGNREYELITVARVLKAYLVASPGPARNSGKKDLLRTKMKDNSIYFAQEDIFLDPDLYNDDEKVEEYYKKVFDLYYKPVNFGVNLRYDLEKLPTPNTKNITLPSLDEVYNSKDFKNLLIDFLNNDSINVPDVSILTKAITPEVDDTTKIISYGKYHLVTFIINYLAKNDKLTAKNNFEMWKTPNNKNKLTNNVIYNHAQVLSIAWKLASLKSHLKLKTSTLNSDSEIRELIAEYLNTNEFKNSKLPKVETEENHLKHAYRYYLDIINHYQKYDSKIKFQ